MMDKLKDLNFYKISIVLYLIGFLTFSYYSFVYFSIGQGGIGLITYIAACTLWITMHVVVGLANNKHNFQVLLDKVEEKRCLKHVKK